MFNTRKVIILVSAVMIALFTSCKFNSFGKKSANVVFDFTSISGKTPTASRSALDTIINENEACYIDLKIQGSYEYSQTINLKETQVVQIENIPVGAIITAAVELYIITKNPDDESKTKEILYSGESKTYTIISGENNIEIPLHKYKTDNPDNDQDPAEDEPNEENGNSSQQEDSSITIWVTYNEQKQITTSSLPLTASAFAFNGSNPEEETGRDGKTEATAFHFINSAIKWIATNGNSSEDYKIILTGYNAQNAFDQGFSIGDEVKGHAKSITITSSDHEHIAIRATCNPIIYMMHPYNSYPGPVPVIFENIQIATAATETTNTSTLILSTYNDSKCDVTLGKDAVFLREDGSTALGSAISVGYGSEITMEENAKIYNFKAAGGAAINVARNSYIYMNGHSNIDHCEASYNGGAIYCWEHGESVYLNENASITNCSAPSGGAIYLKTGSFTMNAGTISECNASAYGGAIYLSTESSDTYCYLYGGTISNNTAEYNGGAIYVKAKDGSMTATLKMKGNIVIDPGTEYKNDIYNAGNTIILDDNLTTENPVAALVTYGSLSGSTKVITSSDTNILANSCSKIKARSSGSQDIYDVDSSGYPDM